MFREAASIILATPAKSKFPVDFGILLLKRTQKLKFMPNAYIFPGGALSKADSDIKWFKKFDPALIKKIVTVYIILFNSIKVKILKQIIQFLKISISWS